MAVHIAQTVAVKNISIAVPKVNVVVGKRRPSAKPAEVAEAEYKPRSLLPVPMATAEVFLPVATVAVLPPEPAAPVIEPLPEDHVEQLREYMARAHLASVFAKPNKEWYFGVSRLIPGSTPVPEDAKHLKQLARASALFDQFCVGMTVDPSRRRVYVGLRLVDRKETAMLPSIDHASQVLAKLTENLSWSSLYAYIEHEDGTVSWCDFGGPVQALIGEQDIPHCEALMAGQPDGMVLSFKYHGCFCLSASNEEMLTKGVGINIDGQLLTRHQLGLPYRDVPLNDLCSNVGHYYRALQTEGFVPFLSNTEREKRRAANKAKRAQSKKGRKK